MNTKRFKFFTVLLLFVASILVSSCGDDEATPAADNHFTFDGNKIAIQGAVFNYDPVASESPVDGNPYHRHYVDLFGPGFTITESSVTGSGDYVDLAISGASVNLDPGTYVFTGTEEDPKAYEMWDARIDFEGNEYIADEATLVITKSGSTFTIEFTATTYPPDAESPWLPDLTQPGKSLTGHFSGSTINIIQD